MAVWIGWRGGFAGLRRGDGGAQAGMAEFLEPGAQLRPVARRGQAQPAHRRLDFRVLVLVARPLLRKPRDFVAQPLARVGRRLTPARARRPWP